MVILFPHLQSQQIIFTRSTHKLFLIAHRQSKFLALPSVSLLKSLGCVSRIIRQSQSAAWEDWSSRPYFPSSFPRCLISNNESPSSLLLSQENGSPLGVHRLLFFRGCHGRERPNGSKNQERLISRQLRYPFYSTDLNCFPSDYKPSPPPRLHTCSHTNTCTCMHEHTHTHTGVFIQLILCADSICLLAKIRNHQSSAQGSFSVTNWPRARWGKGGYTSF